MGGDGMLTNLGRLEAIKIVKEFNREVIAWPSGAGQPIRY
jgi:hypothetical protein